VPGRPVLLPGLPLLHIIKHPVSVLASASEMTCIVSSGALNSTHSLQFLQRRVQNIYLCMVNIVDKLFVYRNRIC